MTPRIDDTNTHTFFLREPESLEAVIRNVSNHNRASVWSAGCSTGEEVYSLAILARESGVDLTVTGSDINRAALAVARRGRYPERRIRNLDSLRRASCFDTAEDGTFVVRDGLRGSLSFVHHDLATEDPLTVGPGGEVRCWDAILCRNVFLYLTADQIDFALAGFARSLKPGGLVFFGASELMSSVLHSHRPRSHGLVLTELDGAWGYRRRDPSSHVLSLPDPAPALVLPDAPPVSTEPDSPAPTSPPTSVLIALRIQGDRFLDAGDPRGALDIFEHAVEHDSLQADLHLRIAVCRLQTGARHLAKEALRRALFLEPELWPAAMLLGDIVEIDEPHAAKRYFQQALDALSSADDRGFDFAGALAPFVAGQRAAAEAIECRLRLLENNESLRRAMGGDL